MNALADKHGAAPSSPLSIPTPPPARVITPDTLAAAGRRRKLVLRGAAAVIVVAAAATVGSWWFSEGRYIESTDNAYVQGDIAVLGSRVEGDVLSIPVADNQVVHAGDPLLTLDPTDFQARLDQARGSAAEAAAAIETARRQAEQATAQIAEAEASIAQAQAEFSRADADAGRTRTLATAGWASRQLDETKIADQRKSVAALTSARAQKDSAIEALAVARAQIAQAVAHKATQDAAVKLAEKALADTVIRAPFDGIVGNRAAQLGQHVNPTLQLISVTPLRDQLYVIANFKETQLRAMRPGQKVLLTPDIDTSAAIEAHVDSLAPATGALYSLLPPENATGNFTKVVQRVPVKLRIDPAVAAKAPWLRAGLSVTAEVDTRGPDAVRHGLFGSIAAVLGLA
jgi:membrane fusion protein (multidrug efflux system)